MEGLGFDAGWIAGCAFVIECVPEDRLLKTDVLSKIEAAAPEAIVATNTSGLAIAGLAKILRAPEALSRTALLLASRADAAC